MTPSNGGSVCRLSSLGLFEMPSRKERPPGPFRSLTLFRCPFPLMLFSSSADAILSSAFCYSDQRFLWSRLRLFEDRIEFLGLKWTGLHRRTVPLDCIKKLRWWTGSSGVNFAMLLRGEGDGEGQEEEERIYLNVEAAGLWKHEVEARVPDLDASGSSLPQSAPAATSSGRGARAA